MSRPEIPRILDIAAQIQASRGINCTVQFAVLESAIATKMPGEVGLKELPGDRMDELREVCRTMETASDMTALVIRFRLGV